jgi:hypothetical protein
MGKPTEVAKSGVRKTRGPSKWKQTDMSKAIRSFQKAGYECVSATIRPDGTIVVTPGAPTIKVVGEVNEWDNAKPG